jgi:hypothetical protein
MAALLNGENKVHSKMRAFDFLHMIYFLERKNLITILGCTFLGEYGDCLFLRKRWAKRLYD